MKKRLIKELERFRNNPVFGVDDINDKNEVFPVQGWWVSEGMY